MQWHLFFSTFVLIFIAELPDKTAMATLMMATQESPWPLFLGVSAAFLVQNIVAVALGSVFGKLPQSWIHLAAGILFLVFAFMAYRNEDEPKQDGENPPDPIAERHAFFRTFWKSFVVIFIAEWGDLTQLATASLTARYSATQGSVLAIFAASTLALWSMTGIVVFVGNRISKKLRPELLRWAAVAVFTGVGVYMLVT